MRSRIGCGCSFVIQPVSTLFMKIPRAAKLSAHVRLIILSAAFAMLVWTCVGLLYSREKLPSIADTLMMWRGPPPRPFHERKELPHENERCQRAHRLGLDELGRRGVLELETPTVGITQVERLAVLVSASGREEGCRVDVRPR